MPDSATALAAPPFSELQRRRASTGHDRLPPGQRLVREWPVLTYGGTPLVETSEWQLQVWGAVGSELALDYGEFTGLGLTETHNDIHCVTHWSRYDNTWKGVLLSALLERAGVLPEAEAVMFHCYGGYMANVRWRTSGRTTTQCWRSSTTGAPLTAQHGGPVRAVIPSLYFWKSAKWVGGMEFLTRDQPGFWEMYGYHMHGDPWREERYG